MLKVFQWAQWPQQPRWPQAKSPITLSYLHYAPIFGIVSAVEAVFNQ